MVVRLMFAKKVDQDIDAFRDMIQQNRDTHPPVPSPVEISPDQVKSAASSSLQTNSRTGIQD